MKRALAASALLPALLGALPLLAQSSDALTVDWITSPEADSITKLPKHFWMADGAVLLFDERKPPAERTFERLLYLLDLAR